MTQLSQMLLERRKEGGHWDPSILKKRVKNSIIGKALQIFTPGHQTSLSPWSFPQRILIS